MKKFVFRYQTILDKYQKDEDDIRNKLYISQKTLQRLMEEKKNCLSEKMYFENNFANSLLNGISVSDYKLYENAGYHYKQTIQKMDIKISECEIELSRLKNEVVEAMKKRKIMESLKEKEYDLFLENIKVAENKVIEEIVNYQSYKKGDRK